MAKLGKGWETLFVIWTAFCVALGIAALYVICHFVVKYW